MSRRVGLRTIASGGGKKPVTIYFASGFEPGDFSEWDGTTGSPTVASDKKYAGAYSEKVNNMDIWWTYGAKKDLSTELSGVTTYYIHGHVYISAFTPSFNNDMVIILGTQKAAGYGYGTLGFMFAVRRVSGVNKLGLWDDDNFVWYDSGLELTVDHWYDIDIEIVVHASSGSVKLYIDNTLKVTVNSIDTTSQDVIFSGASGNEGGIGFGNITLWNDSIQVDDTL